ncbi:DUF6328 family protein [Streptomyces sp. NPDC046821]|uniref:DUF6328 family protein n=1 Tax=Streptomyces sp. NPDC046821 TaxID=3154702 RepID=UPI0033EBC48F
MEQDRPPGDEPSQREPGPADAGQDRHETPLQRADRNFSELLQEVRVTQTGVQILFAFLLTIVFSARFPSLEEWQQSTYIATLLLAVLAAALFTAPAALHRVLFRHHAKPLLVQMSSWFTGAGLAVLMFALTGSVLLAVSVAAGPTAGIAAAASTFVVLAGLWEVLPRLVRRSVIRAQEELESRSRQ